ncbi:hypothetical protein [Sulfurimonas sp.]|uniref:hypothetical protein n=1 Tax=Sulfurimonas sp. TaxID=2022749 RepID=UPI0025F66D82|nr:hypothetical protein [Sulfurimonas sp.]MDD5158051.1 hypothetical protein [Sulfurimonas sp.]
MLKIFAFSLLLALILVGCVKPLPKDSKDLQPAWVLNPSLNGKIGAIGTANRHYKGLAFQRELAITRGLDELALQQGVKISLSIEKKDRVVNDNSTLSMETQGSYSVNSSNVTAHIEDVWRDPISDEIYIWLILDK